MATSTSEKDAKLAQKLGQLQHFITVFSQECMGQFQPNTILSRSYLPGRRESLNIAATVAVCLTEVTRQRSAARTAAAAKGSAEASSYGYEGAELEALVAELVGVASRKALGT